MNTSTAEGIAPGGGAGRTPDWVVRLLDNPVTLFVARVWVISPFLVSGLGKLLDWHAGELKMVGSWRVMSFYSKPVQVRDLQPFDDYSNSHLTYGGFRVERKLSADVNVAAYYSRFKQDGAKFPGVSGNEQRNIGDLRLHGKPGIEEDGARHLRLYVTAPETMP